MNPKDHTFSSSGNPSEPVRKVNAVISLRYGGEIGNQVRNRNEPYRYPHQFFQTSSSSSPPGTGSSSQSGDATDGVPSDSDSPSLLESPSKKEEPKEKDSSYLVDPSPPKDFSSPSSLYAFISFSLYA